MVGSIPLPPHSACLVCYRTAYCDLWFQEVLGHTEDALSEVLNHIYFVSAHIISDLPQGRWKVTEEHFTSLCYAGHLPGYTMSYNHHGFIYSVNIVSAKTLVSGRTRKYRPTLHVYLLHKTQQLCVSITASFLRDSGFESVLWDQLTWGLVWFSSVCTGNCEGIVKQAVNISFQVLSNMSFTVVTPWPMYLRKLWKIQGSVIYHIRWHFRLFSMYPYNMLSVHYSEGPPVVLLIKSAIEVCFYSRYNSLKWTWT